MKSLFKTAHGKASIIKLYEDKLKQLKLKTRTKDIQTSFGKTHIIITGNSNNPPIILIHGANGCAPIALETYLGLKDSFCIYAVDVPGQPNKSDEICLSMKNHSYGQWLHEVIEKLNLNNVTLAGFSLGGLIILKTLEYDETRINQVYLTAPAYIVNGNPIKALLQVFIPMKRFIKTHKQKYIIQFLSKLFTDQDPFALAFLSKVFTEFKMDFSPVPVISIKKANQIKTPITIFAAQEDLMFPGEKMIKRVRKIFPSLKQGILLKGSKHVQGHEHNVQIVNTILEDQS